MLPKSWRLSRSDFIRVKKSGKVYRFPQTSYFILHNSLNHNRFSVVTSTKLSKSAVVRNHLRRQLYSAFARLSGSRDIIIYPSPHLLNFTYDQICSLVDSSLSAPAPDRSAP